MKKIAGLTAAFIMTIVALAQNVYTLDANHSRLAFSVLHFGISNVEGNFKKFTATLVSSEEDFGDAQIEMTADVNSINTEVDMRDADLRDNWFETKKFPTLIFKSTSFKKISGKNYKLKGNITMHGVTKPIEFDVVFNGKVQNPFTKKYLCGFTITGRLYRKDFGLGGDPIATGVSDEIRLSSNVEFIIN